MTDIHAVAQRVRNGAAALEQINSEFDEAVKALRAGQLTEACRGYKSLKDAYDWFDAERKKIYEKLEGISRATIPEMLEEEDVSNVTLDYGEGLKYRFGKTQRVSCSMPDKEGGMAWLRENGGEGLIQETVNASSLSSFAKDYSKEKGADLPPEFFKTTSMVYTSVTKA